jgi:hypothetical protein
VCVFPLKSQNQSQNHQPDSVIHSSDIKHDNNSGSGYVSLSNLPSAQISNDAKGNSDFFQGNFFKSVKISFLKGPYGDHFKHVFSSIGSILAELELEAFQNFAVFCFQIC